MTSQKVNRPLFLCPPCGIPALVDAGPHDDVSPPRTPASTSQRDTAPRPLTHHRHWKAGRSRTVRLHSCGLPVVSLLLGRVLRSSHYFRPSRNLPPSSTSSLRQPDRPGAQPATAPACPLLLVDSCAVHVSTDMKKQAADQSFDQSAARCCYDRKTDVTLLASIRLWLWT